jgi:hypothetical protein
LTFYKICHVLANEIIFNDLITLDEFKSEESYEQLRDTLIKSILTKSGYEEFQRYQSHLFFSRLKYNCTILNYKSCRDYKLEALEHFHRTKKMLYLHYIDSIEDALRIFVKGNSKLDGFMEVMNELNFPKIIIPTREALSNTPQVNTTITEFEETEVELSEIGGEYVEPFKSPYGKLHIRAKSASIDFYFPGPDARYRGTFVYIDENKLDNYIQAYVNNWKRGQELHLKAKDLPDAELKEYGEMGMSIVANRTGHTVYLQSHHLPISSQKEYEDIILQLKRAKLRIHEVRNKLFV